jgi:hypothetical protein
MIIFITRVIFCVFDLGCYIFIFFIVINIILCNTNLLLLWVQPFRWRLHLGHHHHASDFFSYSLYLAADFLVSTLSSYAHHHCLYRRIFLHLSLQLRMLPVYLASKLGCSFFIFAMIAVFILDAGASILFSSAPFSQ